jgi:hypothetical protein
LKHTSAFDLGRLTAWLPELATSLRAWLRWASHHTGLPIVLVAAIAAAVSWRLFRQSLRLALEVAVALALLLVATQLGWIDW